METGNVSELYDCFRTPRYHLERYLGTFCSSRDMGSISSTHMIAHNPPTLVQGFSYLLLASTGTDAQSSIQTWVQAKHLHIKKVPGVFGGFIDGDS